MTYHLVNHSKHRDLQGDSTLHVVGCISNPVRWNSRYRIAREWIDHMNATSGVKLHLVEAAFGDRKHELEHVTEDTLQLRVNHEAWIKEGMLNLGIARAIHKYDAQYIAVVDADVFFRDPDWANKTIHQLQHHAVVQPWENCIDLGPAGNILENHTSFGYLTAHNIQRQRHPGEPYKFGHPGFAWAFTRKFLEETRGLMDFAVLGSADHHMATAMLGEVDTSIHASMTDGFKRLCHAWQRRAFHACLGNVGYVPGRIEHSFHGPKKRRFYRERWQILVDHAFDPETDLRHDAQGLPYIHGKPHLERAIRQYNRSRFEDSVEPF